MSTITIGFKITCLLCFIYSILKKKSTVDQNVFKLHHFSISVHPCSSQDTVHYHECTYGDPNTASAK